MFIREIRKPIRRNPLITRTLYYSKDMESFATGLRRIQDACDKVGCKVEYYGDSYGFTVRFYRHCGEGWGELMHSEAKNAQPHAQPHAQPAAEEKILAYCEEPRLMKEIQAMLGVIDRRTARKYIRNLIEKHKLIMTMPDTPNHPLQRYLTTAENNNEGNT